jgi:hypothetical protein
MSQRAKFVKEITVIDPDTQGEVQIGIYKHQNGGMFGIDASYVDQVLNEDDELEICIADPFRNSNHIVILEE